MRLKCNQLQSLQDIAAVSAELLPKQARVLRRFDLQQFPLFTEDFFGAFLERGERMRVDIENRQVCERNLLCAEYSNRF
ncbi:hypothetical protein WS62_18480 [Burkholderia sp. ABCPW 14]|nr:hypothetical protein WS62_18480 [Burkholderia sp. ABCPW 14]